VVSMTQARSVTATFTVNGTSAAEDSLIAIK
jgi:hypothetical protein